MQNNNPMQMMQAFNQFRQNFTPKTAEAKVRELIATGQMNQSQLNQFQAMATQFQKMFNIK